MLQCGLKFGVQCVWVKMGCTVWGEDVRDDKLAADSSVEHCGVTAVHSTVLYCCALN